VQVRGRGGNPTAEDLAPDLMVGIDGVRAGIILVNAHAIRKSEARRVEHIGARWKKERAPLAWLAARPPMDCVRR